MSTSNSFTDLGLNSTPQVDDPQIYEALLRIHSAIEILLALTDAGGSESAAFITKFRAIRVIDDHTVVLPEDGTIIVSGEFNPVTVTLMPAASVIGRRYNVKCINNTYKVELVGDGTELIDDYVGGVELDVFDSYTVFSTGTGWVII